MYRMICAVAALLVAAAVQPATAEWLRLNPNSALADRDLVQIVVASKRHKDGRAVPLNEETKSAPGGSFSCAREPYLKSEGSSFPTSIRFTNPTPHNVSLFWLDFHGERVAYRTLRSGEAYTQATYFSHPWVIVDSHGACLKIVLPGSTTRAVTIE